ncbi:hypothetical protein BT69DRAFT_1292894 [Atractiella rhizophila]|nr:hypothetical protein BT69DRAFT_1292894 [Atractiella rhizophila]
MSTSKASNPLYTPLPPSLLGGSDSGPTSGTDLASLFPCLFPSITPLQKENQQTSIAGRLEKKNIVLENEKGKRSKWKQEKIDRAREDREKKRKAREIGKKERKRKKKGKDTSLSFDTILPLHHLWLGYMAELLTLPILVPPSPSDPKTMPNLHVRAVSCINHHLTSLPKSRPAHTDVTPADDTLTSKLTNSSIQSMQAKLLKADFHGCLIKVKRSKNASLIGGEGIVVKETQGTWEVVSRKGERKIFPKFNSIFEIALPLVPSTNTAGAEKANGMEVDGEKKEERRELRFEINGTQFCYDPVERVGKKWKGSAAEKGWEH